MTGCRGRAGFSLPTHLALLSLPFVVIPVLFEACEADTARMEAGVCYVDEHLDDGENCGCRGPCLANELCVEGACSPSCVGKLCLGQCGNSLCDYHKGENCQTCPVDCQCPQDDSVVLAMNVLVVDGASALGFVEKGEDGAILLRPSSDGEIQPLTPGTVLLSGLAHGRLFNSVFDAFVVGNNYYVPQSTTPYVDRVVESAVFSFEVAPDFSRAYVSGLHAGGALTASPVEAEEVYPNGLLKVPLDGKLLKGVVVSDWEGNEATVSFEIAQGDLQFTAIPLFELVLGRIDSFPFFQVNRLVAGLDLSLDLHIQTALTVSDELHEFDFEGADFLGVEVPVEFDAIPGWLDLEVHWKPAFHVDTDEELLLATGFASKTSGLLGVAFVNGGWSSLKELNITVEPLETGATGTAPFSATFTLDSVLRLEPWGLPGVRLAVSQAVRVDGDVVYKPLRIAWSMLFGKTISTEFDGDWFSWNAVPPFSESSYEFAHLAGGDAPFQVCGDGIRSGTEECDGEDLGGNSCLTVDEGFNGGTLGCDQAACQFDFSGCCSPDSFSKCSGAKLYWYDSCGNIGNVRDDCDDSAHCTVDSCVGDQCVHVPVSNCCDSELDCDGGKLCIEHDCVCKEEHHTACSEGHIFWFDSCQNRGSIAESCADGNPCTIDLCQEGECSYASITGCCHTDEECGGGQVCQNGLCLCKPNSWKQCADGQLQWYDSCGAPGTIADTCDDKNPCTADTCAGAECAHSPANDGAVCGAAGTCSTGICVEP